MCMYKAGIILVIELLVISAGFYFLYLSEREKSKHLKRGGYVLVIGGILIALSTAVMTVKHMCCHGKHHCERCHHGEGHGPGYDEGEGKPQCHDGDNEEKGEKSE